MFLFMIDKIASLQMRIVPPSPMISSIAPCRPRKKASDTTKLGMPRRATSSAIVKPIATPVASAARTASGQAQPLLGQGHAEDRRAHAGR